MPRIHYRQVQQTQVLPPVSNQKKAVDYFGTPKEFGLSLMADGCMAIIGSGAGFLGTKTLVTIIMAATTGGLLGSIEGVRKALLKHPELDFQMNIACSFPFFGMASCLAGETQLASVGSGIFCASSGFVGSAVHANITRLNVKSFSVSGKALEWMVGAAAATTMAGAASPVVGFGGGIVAGIAAAKVAKMAARGIWSTIFG